MNLLVAYIHPALYLAISALCITAGIVTFGNGLYFDRFFYVTLIFALFICRKNIDLIGVILILLAERTFEETAWLFIDIYNEPVVKLLLYGILCWVYWTFRHDPKNKYLLSSLLTVVIAAECYWYITDYKAPPVIWYTINIFQHLVVRWFLFTRYEHTDKYFPGKACALCQAEFRTYAAYQIGIYVLALQILEYVVRHIAGIDMYFFYEIHPYLMHMIAIYVIWLVLQESTQIQFSKRVAA